MIRLRAGIAAAVSVLTFIACGGAAGTPYTGSFVHVVETDESAQRTGQASPRALYAELLERLPAAGDRTLTLKFFLFDDRDAAEDGRLAAAMGRYRTYTQYALVGQGSGVARVTADVVGAVSAPAAAVPARLHEADGSEMPVPRFLERLEGAGFVDVVEPFDADRIPLLGRGADGSVVKSLALLLLESVHGQATLVTGAGGPALSFGGTVVRLDDRGRAECPALKTEVATVPIEDVLASPERFGNGWSLVVSYGGSQSPSFSLGFLRSINAHDLFFQRLACLDAALAGR